MTTPRRPNGSDPIPKFFILGCPRSGTTMLQQALNRHSRIVIPPETKFFFSFFGHPKRQQARHVARLNADLGIDLAVPPRRIRSVEEGREFYDDMATRYLDRQPKSDVAYFGEKTPEHTGRLPDIRRLFPDAKIVFLQRDGRDVASSLTRVPWMSPNLYVNFLVWLYYNRIIEREKRLALPNVYFARYEDIVADPEGELGAILDFLDLPYEPAVAEGHGNREGVPQRELAWKGRALQPITTRRAAAFTKELTPDQIRTLESMGGDALASLGYSLSSTGAEPLSAVFCASVAVGVAKLAIRLPWYSAYKDLLCRFVSGPSTHPSQELSPAARRDDFSLQMASPGFAR
jgi:hypothetical protein